MQKTRAFLVAAALCAAAAAGCQRPEQRGGGQITIKGSDTMVHLVTAWAEEYMKKYPGVNVSVTGGGSGTGIAAMINGTTNIAMASRSFKEKEIKLAQKRGVTPKEHVTALDGIAVVVHPDNPVKELTLEQLRRIFTGKTTDWQDLGGKAQPVTVLSRESNSGTYVYFQEAVLQKEDYTARARLMPSSAAIVQSAEQDTGVIGYVGVAYGENSKAKIITVKAKPDSPGVFPSAENIKSGQYPIARPLYLYTAGEAQGEAKGFLDFVFSPEGQGLVKEIGYVPAG